MVVAILLLLGAIWAAVLAMSPSEVPSARRGPGASEDGHRCAWHHWERRAGTLICARCGFRSGDGDRPAGRELEL